MATVNIGKNIANLRKSKGKTAEQLAEALRVSRQTVSKWENGETIPNAYNMLDIATYLDTSVSDIYEQIMMDRIAKDNIQDEKKTIYDQFVDATASHVDEVRDIKDAIIAFERSFVPFKVEVGVNTISYEDVLRRFNSEYVMGVKESEHPVLAQRLRSIEFVIPGLVEYLKESNLVVFYDGFCFMDDASFILVLRNEHEVLEFKELMKMFYIGLVSFDDHKRLCELFAISQRTVRDHKENETKRFNVGICNLTDADAPTLFDVGSVDTKAEAESMVEMILSLDESILKVFLEECGGGTIICIEDAEKGKIIAAYDPNQKEPRIELKDN